MLGRCGVVRRKAPSYTRGKGFVVLRSRLRYEAAKLFAIRAGLFYRHAREFSAITAESFSR